MTKLTLHRLLSNLFPLALLLVGNVWLATGAAQAVPSFARQTGQPCAACHTAFPELTPFGRSFKLNGYTLEGGDSKLPPLSAMVQTAFTHYAKSLDASPGNGFSTNDNVDPAQQASVFYAGRITDNLGAFVQLTYANSFDGRTISLDNTDLRYTNSTKFGDNDMVYGISINNVPSVQDVWNTTPVWRYPFIASAGLAGPRFGTMLESFSPSAQLGAGAYIYVHDIVYAELSAYGSTSQTAQNAVGLSPSASAISGLAPYWRLAIEPKWGDQSLMIGTFGMMADIIPDLTAADRSATDKYLDLGVDAQYQWIGDVHAVTFRTSYIYENQTLDATFGLGGADNQKNRLQSFRSSLSYIYDHKVSLTGGYFALSGSADTTLYSSISSGKPDSAGFVTDIAYLPFSRGGPSEWPWLNARIGVSYTTYSKLDGNSVNVGDNNTILVYAWTAF